MPVFTSRDAIHRVLTEGFGQRKVMVVGDLMLDRYLWGEVRRVSPEAPVPVVRLTRESQGCGGAANVALNLARLGLRPVVAGIVGDDAEGRLLGDLLTEDGVATGALIVLPGWPTITKTRIIGGHQQMLRLDMEHPLPSGTPAPEQLLNAVAQQMVSADPPAALLLSDYAKGVLSPRVCATLIERGRALGIPVLVDPKGSDYAKYRGATTLSPNRQELATALGRPVDDLDTLLAEGEALRRRLELEFLTVTLSELGLALLDGGATPRRIPAMAREVFDVSGAGDTVIATLTAGLVAGLERLDALGVANLAAGVVVGKVGTTPITRDELRAALDNRQAMEQSDKVASLEEVVGRVNAWRDRGERTVFTNGCFDLLHAGHVTYLEKARHLGHRLVVGLNTDRSVRALKGSDRPLIREDDRARVLAALAAVDAVVLFDEETPLRLIRALRPEVLAKGADYTEDQVVGGTEVKSWGGEVALVPLVAGRSTSRIVADIQTHRQQAGD
ncbi:MAG: D-glycero-beta-D-manno-heptose-7-phosphate kinase [Magnetococcales bacterium]|nr:D-glycero-beta-D-manno-heptose-7-phosphate kinase [Magnetococcales bacterium]